MSSNLVGYIVKLEMFIKSENNIKLESVLHKTSSNKYAIIFHPHPLYGGNMNNKVVFTLDKALKENNFNTLKINFRGCGKSTGSYCDGVGEYVDACYGLEFIKNLANLSGKEKAEIWVAGFSFGAFIAIKLLEKYLANIHKTILLGIPFSLFDISLIQKINFEGLVIHGEMDEITEMDVFKENIEKSLAYQNKKLVVNILEKNDHFFSNNLENLKNTINKYIKNVK